MLQVESAILTTWTHKRCGYSLAVWIFQENINNISRSLIAAQSAICAVHNVIDTILTDTFEKHIEASIATVIEFFSEHLKLFSYSFINKFISLHLYGP